MTAPATNANLVRHLGLVGLAATGICSMLGAAINVIPLALQRSVPGIGPWVLFAYALAAVPAVFAALSYATLAQAMPRAGGSYIFVSRSLNPFLGFIASFSQWFGLSVAIGVVSYVIPPFLRDIVAALADAETAAILEIGWVRVGISLTLLWTFVGVNIVGLRLYERILVPMMIAMFAAGLVVIVAGFAFDHADFLAAVQAAEGVEIVAQPTPALSLGRLMAAAVVLFSSFIGFDSIAQAGGEARNPERNLPVAILIAIFGVGTYYLLFTAAIYHAVPWYFIAERSLSQDLTAPGLLGYLLTPGWTVAIVAGAAIALINDLPAMLLAVSRLMFSWAEDGIFPSAVQRVSARWRTPHVALIASGAMATASVLGSHLAGDFFLGVDVLVTAMLLNFALVSLSLVLLPRRNPALAPRLRLLGSTARRNAVGGIGFLLLTALLVIQIYGDLTAEVAAWYYRSTWMWLAVMAGASLVFARSWRKFHDDPVRRAAFRQLPPQ